MSRQTKAREPTLRDLRRSVGMSQDQLASQVGYSARQIARWEKGEGRVREAIVQFLRNLQPKPPAPEACHFTFIDLFAGIGGFRRGFESVGGRCVFMSERDKFAQVTCTANYGDEGVHGDVAKVKAKDIPDHDILLAGFPCQPFRMAEVSRKHSPGRQHGVEYETQGTLFFDIERIIDAKRPKAFVLETAKNLASHDKGRTFEVIRRTLEKKLGYRVSVRIVDAKSFLPQHRERTFIVGTRPDIGAAFNWGTVDIPDPGWGPRLAAILHAEDGSEPPEERYTDAKGRVLAKYVLTNHLWQYLKEDGARQRATGKEVSRPLYPEEVARNFSARYYKDGSEVLIQRRRGNPRRLTPRECARLMGFDREGAPPFRIVVSDTQAYKQFGSATAVPVVEAIARALAPRIAGTKPAKRRTRGTA